MTDSSESLTAGTEKLEHDRRRIDPFPWITVRRRTISPGEFLDKQDISDHEAVVVLGSVTASELFRPRATRSDRAVNVDGLPLTVVGVLTPSGASSTSSSTIADPG